MAWLQFKTLRDEVRTRPDVQAALKVATDEHYAAMKVARAECGLYWGTYLQVEQAISAANSKPTGPQFRRWTGDGKLAVQIQSGMAIDDLFDGNDMRLRVERTRIGDPKRPWCFLNFRVGSTDTGKPIFASVKFRYHRPLPPECRIKWAYLIRDVSGPTTRWEVQFVIASTDPATFAKRVSSTGTVALDIGWRPLNNGDVRAAYWHSDGGDEGQLVVPGRLVDSFLKINDLESIRRGHFTEIIEYLIVHRDSFSPWLAEQTETMALWKSFGRLAAVAIRWRENRFDGDTLLFDRVESWRKQDKHLWNYQSGLRHRTAQRRVELYAQFVADLRQRFSTVLLEEFDLRKIAKRPDEDQEPDRRDRQEVRHWACLSSLRRLIKESGVDVVAIPAQNTTRECHACGYVSTFDDQWPLVLTCQNSSCGISWDQDVNAARVIFARGSATAISPGPLAD